MKQQHAVILGLISHWIADSFEGSHARKKDRQAFRCRIDESGPSAIFSRILCTAYASPSAGTKTSMTSPPLLHHELSDFLAQSLRRILCLHKDQRSSRLNAGRRSQKLLLVVFSHAGTSLSWKGANKAERPAFWPKDTVGHCVKAQAIWEASSDSKVDWRNIALSFAQG